MPPIALATDFGEEDFYVGAMKGAILSVDPEANIIDITHNIPKHDVQTASFIIANAAETFPRDTTFVAVVDPGVGTERRCILLRTENGLNFIGPDNGVFTLPAEQFGVDEIREVSNEELMRSDISSTFHGRDVMASVGAHLSMGTEFSEVGPKIENMTLLEVEGPKMSGDGIRGRVIKVDDFGNLVTNVGKELMEELGDPGDIFKIQIGKSELEVPFLKTFGEVPEGEKLCYFGSANLLEIAKNRGNLASDLNLEKEDELNIRITR